MVKLREFDDAHDFAAVWTQIASQNENKLQMTRSFRIGAWSDFEKAVVDPSLRVGDRSDYLVKAQNTLVDALDVLIGTVAPSDPEKGHELGHTYELLGRVRHKRGLITAKEDLMRARQYFVDYGFGADVERVDQIVAGIELAD